MMKRGFWKTPAVMAALGLALAMSLTGCPTESKSGDDHRGSASMLESAHPNNDFGTTAIVLEFDGSVVGLRPENIVVFEGTGDVKTGELSGGGSRWSLGVTVLRYGIVSVKIDRDGISGETHEVTVHPVVWTARWDSSTPDKPAIIFTFPVPVAELGLVASDIRLIAPVGAVSTGRLTNIDGRNWSLEVLLEGDVPYVLAEIYRAGIMHFGPRDATSPFTVPTSTTMLERAVINVSEVTGDKTMVLTFSHPVLSLATGNIIITDGTGSFKLGSTGLTAQDGLTLSDKGITWTVPVTVERPGGLASVAINRPGISKEPVTVEVPGVMLISAVISDSVVSGQKSLVLTFSGPVPNLDVANIIVKDGTGSFILGKPNLSAAEGIASFDNGRIWTVPVTVAREGEASVSVDRTGIPSHPVAVTVPGLIQIISATFQPGDVGSRWIEFTLSQPVPGLERANIQVVNESGALTLASGTESLQGAHPWTTWRVDVTHIQREGVVSLSIVNRDGVSSSPARVANVRQIYVVSGRVVNAWDGVSLPAGATVPTGAGSVGLEIVLSEPVNSAPGIEFVNLETSYTLLVTAGEVFGYGTTWVLQLTVANHGLAAGYWGSGKLMDVTVTGELSPGAPAGALGNIRTVIMPQVWGLVGPGAPSTWTDPGVLPPAAGWSVQP